MRIEIRSCPASTSICASDETFLAPGALYGINLDFWPIPPRNVDGSVDILNFDAPLRGQRIDLVKLFGVISLAVGSLCGAGDQKKPRNTVSRREA